MTPSPCDLAVTGATVLPFDARWTVLQRCDIVVAAGRIVALGRGTAIGYEARQAIDGRNLVVIPGLCNAHTHSPESLARGLADGAPLAGWIDTVWSSLDAIDAEAVELGVLLAAAEMLHAGVTSVVDHFRQTPLRADAVNAAAAAWERSGMRALVALMVRDRAIPAGRTVGTIDEQLGLVEAAVSRWHGTAGRVQIGAGPSAPTRCSEAMLGAIDALARREGLRVHMHCDETRAEAAQAQERFGTSAIRQLARLGALGPHVSLAHAVWVDDGDIEALARSGAGVVHNPVSNLRLGSGRAPLERFLHEGIDVAIGTDGAASNDTQHVLEAAKLAALLPRAALEDPARWPSGRDALALASLAPARMFGMGGALAVGAAADFAAFDSASPPLTPANDLHTQIVFAGGTLRARHVVVNGEWALRDGRITTFDEQAIAERAREWRDGPPRPGDAERGSGA